MTEDERMEAEAFTIYGTPRTYQEVIQEDGITVDGTTRKRRIVDTLDGTPAKGTVIVVCRGTKDKQDILADISFGGVVEGTEVESLDDNNTYYKTEIKPHVQRILTTQFTNPGSSANTYKQNWDVFSTGHSLGGALAEQLILDGLCKGGMSFAAPRTTRSNRERPAYSLISASDMVIARTANAANAVYDFANPEYTGLKLDKGGNVMEAASHGHDVMSLGVIESTDGGPLWNNSKYYDMEVTKYNDEYDDLTGSFVNRKDIFKPPLPGTTPKGDSGVETDPTDDAPDPNSTLSKISDIGSKTVKGISKITEKAKNYILYGTTDDVEERGSGSKRGAGPAPKADYMRRMARDIYKPFNQSLQSMAEKGLELPEYRYTKKEGSLTSGVSVQFFIISTPINVVDYYRMPVFKVIKQQITSLDDPSNKDALGKYLTLLSENASI